VCIAEYACKYVPRIKQLVMRLFLRAEGCGDFEWSAEELNDILQTCLDCGACAEICPNGIHPEKLIVKYRAHEVAMHGVKTWEKWLLNLFTSPESVHTHFKALKGVIPLSALIPTKKIKNIRSNFPEVAKRPFSELMPPGTYKGEGKINGTVFFFEGCVMGGLLAEASKASVQVLIKLGWNVILQKQESCCGALHIHRGSFSTAMDMAKAQLDSIPLEQADWVISDCAACCKSLENYKEMFPDGNMSEKAKRLSEKTKHLIDLIPAEILSEKIPKTIFHRSCQYTPDIAHKEVIYQPKTRCCGSAGIFSILHEELSETILASLREEITRTGAETVVAINPGCYFKIKKTLYGKSKVKYISEYFLDLI